MTRLRGSDVIQIDATVIAGLLILLTVQSLTQSNFDWKSENQRILETINLQKAQSDIDYSSALDLIQHLKSDQQNVTDKVRFDLIQKQIDDTELKLWQAKSEGTALLDARDKLLQQGTASSTGLSRETLVKVFAITMALPFAASAATELGYTFSKKEINDDNATKVGRIWMIIGFLVLMIGLYGIEQLIT